MHGSNAAKRLRQRPDTLELAVLGTDNEIILEDNTEAAAYAGDAETAAETAANAAAAATRRTRWFQFGRKSRRRRHRLPETHCDDDNVDVSDAKTNSGARLALPETTNIGNSTQTIATPLPITPSPNAQTQAPLHSNSLYSLATLETPCDLEQYKQQHHSAPNLQQAVNCEMRMSPPGSNFDDVNDSDSCNCLMWLLQKLAFWRRRKQRRRKRRQYSAAGSSAASVEPACGSGEPVLLPRQSRHVSADLEQISAATSQRNLRRLSQLRRRRSSYYFSENERRIRANDKDFNSQFKYHNNYIKTSKYTLLTFLPFNLLEQFQRLANFYFLCLLVLQLIPAISSLTPVTTAIPLIGVLTLTAVKDAYDDIQRHLSDSQVNNRKSKTLRNGKLIDAKWSEVQVGDVIRLDNNQFVAADILLLTTSEPNGLCFIETAELDGETNLKAKQCLQETTDLGQQHDLLWSFNGEIICERPNNLLNKFEGTLIWKNQRFALDNDKILLRGCVLRNTQWCYGVVVFAGVDTKLMQNSGKTQFKSTGVDRLLNFIIIGIVLFLVSICAFFAVACAIWEGLIGQYFQLYLPWENIIPKEVVASGATIIGLLVFFSYAIVLNTVVPISLYVSVEVIRFAQSFLINWDEEMYYARTNTYAKARTTTLNEELGQIQYIFSDKTGTLTQNIMTFNKCSINGRTYGDVIDLRTGELIEITEQQQIFQNSNNNNDSNQSHNSNYKSNSNQVKSSSPKPMPPTILVHKADIHAKKSTLLVNASGITELAAAEKLQGNIVSPTAAAATSCMPETQSAARGKTQRKHVRYSAPTASSSSMAALSSTDEDDAGAMDVARGCSSLSSPTHSSSGSSGASGSGGTLGGYLTRGGARMRRQLSTLSTTSSDKALESVDFSANPHHEADFRWYDRTLLDAVRSDEPHSHVFFRLLALCHTVMAESVDGHLEYQAQSPDEAALVSAARNFGFVFRTRTPNSITIEVMGHLEEYELLNILDFNNIRKRMSVILRRGNKVVLYCKGADNVIYDRLHNGQEDLKARTQDHLNKFAGEGLRTLVLAERHLTEEYYNDWRARQQEAALSMDSREDKLNAIYEEIESDMSLVGVTAIEDKLQDGVPKSIANLQSAGIKIWVLTGDKQETAVNIGYSCQLLTDELADVFIVDGSSVEEVEKQLRQFKESIKIFNRFRPSGGADALNHLNGANSMDALSVTMTQTSAFMQELNTPPPQPPPAISVVTFSAECNDVFDAEKGTDARASIGLDETSGFALVVNGHSLVHCLSPELETKFLEIASQCKAVICCRVTPLQKALVVELIKRAKNAVTLAIGDGANDVSMIKAAHIGVGISGQEGLQAVLSSDYAIAQFRYLERLLLVHGRWSYYRMCKFLRYFFYKNFAFTLCHCWYSLFCGFSAQTVFDPMFISVYNLFYTSLPVLALGVFEQDVSDKNSLEFPRLYAPGLKSELFNIREFIYSVLHGFFTSLILFLIPYGTYKDGISANGYILSDHMTLGAVVATILIIDNTAQVALYTSYWTIVNHVTIWGSLVWYFVLDYFYNYVIGGPYVGSLTQAIKDLTFWVTLLITVVILMAPVLAYKFYLLDVHPSLSDKIRQKSLKTQSRASSDVRRTPSARRGRRSVRSGYAFAHQEGFGRLITSGKIMHKKPQDFAFPLGLGTKKTQSLHNNVGTAASGDSVGSKSSNNNNNTSQRYNQNHSSMADITADGRADSGQGSRGSDDMSPRAPCQDLDTINL